MVKYYGGKGRFGSKIAKHINNFISDHDNVIYIEPFCGALGVFNHIDISKCDYVFLNDISDISDLWKHSINVSPFSIRLDSFQKFKADWYYYKSFPEYTISNIYAYFFSWGGIKFSSPLNSIDQVIDQYNSYLNIVSKISPFREKITFQKKDYFDFFDFNFNPNFNYIIYFDPPYDNTFWTKNWKATNYSKNQLANLINHLNQLPNVFIFLSELDSIDYIDSDSLYIVDYFQRNNKYFNHTEKSTDKQIRYDTLYFINK